MDVLTVAILFALVFIFGKFLEKLKIPWVFAALIIGLGLSILGIDLKNFEMFAELGMYFMLFLIGFEINPSEMAKKGKFIVKSTLFIILSEAAIGSFAIHYVFSESWYVSILVALSFATVGEAVLLPILDEFKLINTDLGQTIIGIGVMDDAVEILTVILASMLVGLNIGHSGYHITTNLFVLTSLFVLAFVLSKWKKEIDKFVKFHDTDIAFLIIIFLLFFFVGIGSYADASALGALLAGMSARKIIPKYKIDSVGKEIHTVTYGLFAPFFFLWVGLDTDVRYLLSNPLLVFGLMLIVNITKVVASYISTKNEIGWKKSIILGVALCVKFSTSIVIIKLLFEQGLITSQLYSVLVGTTIAFKFVVPYLMSHLIRKWILKS